MDTSSAPLLDYSLQYQWCSDSDLSCISSPETLSPVHSMDSSFSPPYTQPPQSTPRAAKTGYSQGLNSSPSSMSGSSQKIVRANRFRSKQRESASEKEKLRMRDLTKALHHLRSYLPPSVAPVGQTLTKIETLRLTIRYISYLSAQLGLSEEVLQQRRSFGYVEKVQTLNQFLGHQPSGSYSSQELRDDSVNAEQHSYQVCLWSPLIEPVFLLFSL
uniref:Mesoderm posterior bb n=1 Tax=Nothobranchius furzeri TaxID=105023 RepID=A0A8C6M5J2_NOTFU